MKNLRIAFTGPECSGKTTTSRALAATLPEAVWVAEVARHYLSQLPDPANYSAFDLQSIASETLQKFSEAQGMLVADTEFFVLEIWSEEVFGERDDRLVEMRQAFPFDLYFLCSPDIPWEYDPLRANPFDRDRLFALYEERLQKAGVNYVKLQGNEEQRLASAIAEVSRYLDAS